MAAIRNKPLFARTSTAWTEFYAQQPMLLTYLLTLTLNISKMAADTVIVTMEGEYETVPKLLNGTTFNDLSDL